MSILGGGAQASSNGEQQPANVTESSAGEQKPAEGASAPATGEQKPEEGAQAGEHGPSGQETATGAQASATGTQPVATRPALDQVLDRAGADAELTRQLAAMNQMLSTMAAADPKVRAATNAQAEHPLLDNKGLFPGMRSHYSAPSAQDINAFSSSRPWNDHAREAIQASRQGLTYTAQNAFVSSFVMKQLEADIAQELFLLPASRMEDLSEDARRLPSFWRNAYNVQNGQMYGLSEAGHVIQPFGDGFKPNNEVVFQPEVVTLQKVEINYEFDVDRLAQIENGWLMLFNQPKGSANAYKPPFVRYMLMVLNGVKESDLREALVSGVWAPNSTRKPGYYLNSITGLFYKIEQARGKKFRPFTTLGKPNTSNIVDYVENYCQAVEDAVGKKNNMKFYMAPKYATAYRRQMADRLQILVNQVSLVVDGYPNFEIIPFDYLTGDFMFCTDANNIVITNGPAAEENQLRVVTTIKSLQMAGQFYKGIHVGVFGMEISETDPVNMRSQRFFSNAEDIQYASVPAPADATTLSAKYGNVIRIGANTAEQTITGITDYQVGRLITIEGPMPVVSGQGTITDAPYGAKIVPGSTFIDPNSKAEYVLKTGNSLRLMPLGGDKFAVVGYNGGPVADQTVQLAADATEVPQPLDRQIFVTTANTAETKIATIAEPENPYNGFSIRIKGGSSTNATTIETTSSIILRESIILDTDKEVTLRYQDGVWYEIARK